MISSFSLGALTPCDASGDNACLSRASTNNALFSEDHMKLAFGLLKELNALTAES
jgi:hypothetical protein